MYTVTFCKKRHNKPARHMALTHIPSKHNIAIANRVLASMQVEA